jgi:hypothetical protein
VNTYYWSTFHVSGNFFAISILLRSSTILLIVGLSCRSDFTHLNAISMHVLISCDACDHIIACSLFSQFSHTYKMESKCWHVTYIQSMGKTQHNFMKDKFMIQKLITYKLNDFGRSIHMVIVVLASCHYMYYYNTQTEYIIFWWDFLLVDVFWWCVSSARYQI